MPAPQPGEMARLVREFDWAATPLGPMAAWPAGLGAVVDLLLAHPMPSILLWGPSLVQVYNDAYARMTDADPPASLGRPAREGWGAWGINAPIYERVVHRGESVLLEDHPFPNNRHGGRKHRFFTASYSPVQGAGRIAGVFATVIETTGKVLAETEIRESEGPQAFLLRLSDALRPLVDPAEVQAEACRLVGEHLGADRAYYVEVDEAAGVARVQRDYLRGDSPSLAGEHRVDVFGWVVPPMRTGRTLIVPDVGRSDLVTKSDLPAMEAVRIAAHVNAPLVKGGVLVGALCVTEPRPRDWAPAEVELVRETAERIWAAVERARAEAALRASEDRLRAIAANMPSGAVFLVDRDLRYVLAGGEALGTAGLDPSELEGRTLAEVVAPESLAEYTANYRRALDGEPFRVEHSAHGRHFVTHGIPLADARGAVTSVLAVSYDITDRKRAEERLRLALKAARMGTWRWEVDSDRHSRDANLNRLLGRTAEESAGPLSDFLASIHPDDRERVSDVFHKSIRPGRNMRVEFRIVRPDGTTRWLRDQGDVFGGPEGRYLAGACVDVTDLKEAEESLRESNVRFRSIANLVPDLLWSSQPDGYTGWYNQRWSEYTGQAHEQAIGWGWADAIHPDDREGSARRYGEAVESGKTLVQEHRIRRHDGEYRWFLVRAEPVRDEAGHLTMFGSATDIQDQRSTRDELEARVAKRTADLENESARRRDLARRLVTAQEDERRRVSRDLHDSAGQLLVGLNLAMKAAESGGLPSASAEKLGEARRIVAALTKEIHDLAVRLRPTSLDDVGLEPALGQLVAEWSGRTGIRADFRAKGIETGRLPTEVETAIFRAVQEALTNVAKHAGASTVSVTVVRPDGHVSAAIEDDGSGFDPGAAPRGRLGLAGMRERVEAAGGEVEVESAPASGTTIFLRFDIPGTNPVRETGDGGATPNPE